MNKICTKCGDEKPLEEFALLSKGKHGRHAQCKACARRYANERYKNDTVFREQLKAVSRIRVMKAYYSDLASSRAKARIRAHSTNGLERLRIQSIKYRGNVENREKIKARSALNEAVRSGKINRPRTCSTPGCGNSNVTAHHHNGYDREHWFDVIWLCLICHKAAERPIVFLEKS